jgi:hypothetical protein
LKDAQACVLNLSNWHQFLQSVMLAGFRSGRLITSTNTLLYSYVMFLIGKLQFKVPPQQLKIVIARWTFMSALTSRYTGTYESQIESDLNRLHSVQSADGFVDMLERIITENLTDDYWSIGLPSQLETTAARSPTLYAYYAALTLLRARVLFSSNSVSDLLDPSLRGNRLAVERHHLFPVAYLKGQGIDAPRDYDQIANFALLEWPDNASIGANPPAVYAPAMFASLPPEEQVRQRLWHALPEGWTDLSYAEFLARRRKLLAQVVRRGFERIGNVDFGAEEPTPGTLAGLIAAGENATVEFKSTARWSLADGRVHDAVEFAIARTVAGFLNTSGGTLVIGVADDGSLVGLQHDYATLKKKDRDGFELFLTDLLANGLGKNALSWIEVAFDALDGKDVARVIVKRSPSIVFLNPKGQKVDDVYVRFGNSTRKLTPAELLQYMKDSGGDGAAPFTDVAGQPFDATELNPVT